MVLRIEAHEDVLRSFLEERHLMGGDKWDEMWDGVLHLRPCPSVEHQRLGTEILCATKPLADSRGLLLVHRLSLFRPGSGEADYRNPDLVCFLPHDGRLETAELVVEILSPGDESYQKIPWYVEKLGVREVLLVAPVARVPELYSRRADSKGVVRSEVLGVTFEAVAGPLLRLSWEGGETAV